MFSVWIINESITLYSQVCVEYTNSSSFEMMVYQVNTVWIQLLTQLFGVWTDKKLTPESFKWLFSFMFWGTGYYSSLLVVYMPVQIQSECELAYGKNLRWLISGLAAPYWFYNYVVFCYKYLSVWNLRLCVYTVSHYLWCDSGMETPKQEYRHSACTYGLIYSIHSCPCDTISNERPQSDHLAV